MQGLGFRVFVRYGREGVERVIFRSGRGGVSLWLASRVHRLSDTTSPLRRVFAVVEKRTNLVLMQF